MSFYKSDEEDSFKIKTNATFKSIEVTVKSNKQSETFSHTFSLKKEMLEKGLKLIYKDQNNIASITVKQIGRTR